MVTPIREQSAAWALMGICAERGDKLTVDNATRIIEQGGKMLDSERGITPHDRRAIEEARTICARMSRSKTPEITITKRELRLVRSAVAIIQGAPQRRKRDQALLDQLGQIKGRRVKVH
jgi:hypothetical protein